ncbi:outer membrane lipoprotein-sorting protein [Malonomonas rubra]|uniref:outer membrane lipoprotein-sorting protein n=1 Tax=Malonomonas rubra TaxID=57040 RepID=UPI0026EA1EDB|nr:outer membrane lipoprotein-sorting protein [Malonomonas rubra]
MRAFRTMLLALFTLLLFAAPLLAAELTAQEIVEKANRASYYAGKDGKADITMTITAPDGSTRSREFTMLRLNDQGEDQKFYVYFKEPADVRKMAYLVWKNAGRDDDRWLWLPALNLKKRIAPGDKRTSFVGSDFFYEDVSGRGTHEDTHQLVEETDQAYVLRNEPKDANSVEFAWYQVWIDKQNFLPLKAIYYDRQGQAYRQVEALKVQTIDGHPTVTEAKAADLRAGTSTVNSFSNVSYDIGLNPRIFTERFLRRPPREVGN